LAQARHGLFVNSLCQNNKIKSKGFDAIFRPAQAFRLKTAKIDKIYAQTKMPSALPSSLYFFTFFTKSL
jgi:hypothetical protein